MKTELYYNPSGPWTRVSVNGADVNQDDVYGFLYPVRRCLLQAWLYPSGSWQGLRRQLEELARGEAVELVFHGRKTDYLDVEEALRGMPGMTLRCRPRENVLSAGQLAKSFRDFLREKVVVERDGRREITREWGTLFPEEARAMQEQLAEKQEWLQEIRSEQEFRQALRGHGCCLVTEDFLTSYEDLVRLEQLVRSMRRAQDMIVCRFARRETMEEYRDYARHTLGLGLRFVTGADNGWRSELMDKYGSPLMEQRQLNACNACAKVLEDCLEGRGPMEARLRQLRARGEESREAQQLEYRQAGMKTLARRLPALQEQLKIAFRQNQEVSP